MKRATLCRSVVFRSLQFLATVEMIGFALGQPAAISPGPATRSADGVANLARFDATSGIAVAGSGKVSVTDYSNNTVRLGAPISAPTIATQPQAQTVQVGASVTFTVVVTGTPAPNFQWLRDGTAIGGATSATLRISGVQISDAGFYAVVVTTSAGGSVTSNAALLTVDAAGISVGSRSFIGDHITYAARGTVTGALVYGGQGTATNSSWSGKIVLLDRGTGTFYAKVHNVQLSGGLACVIANNVSGGISATLSEGNSSSIPAITVSQEDGAVLKPLVNSNATVSTLLVGATPAITAQPKAQTACAGDRVTLSVSAAGAGPLSYQWQLNGANIAGATNSTLSVASLQPSASGDYTVVVRNSTGSVTSNVACLNLVPGRLINLSILTPIGSGDPLTVGAVIGGQGVSGPLPLLIRGVGPSLTPLGVGGALGDPKLEVFSGPTVVASNDNWGGDAGLSGSFSLVGAFPFSSATAKDAAVFFGPNITAPPASYTVQVTGVSGASGTALAEVYDAFPAGLLDATTPRLINLSVLKQIAATGSLTAGFVVGGATPKQLLIRAIGPTLGLAPFNVGGVMPDPKLTLFAATGNPIAANDNWSGDAPLAAAFAGAGAFTLPATSRDAALLVTLIPGSYTAQIAPSTAAGAAQGGLALVEVYDLEGGAAPAFSTQPANLSAVSGSTVMFSVNAIGAVGYQWQRLPAGSSTWVNLADGGGFFGTTTAGLMASEDAVRNGDQFRAVVTNFSGATRSNQVSLTLTAAPGAINVAGFTAPTAATMSLITVNATGLTPTAVTFVEFMNASGAVVAQVPPVAVTATSLTVAVPPLLGSDGTSLVAGVLTARIGQFVGSGTVTSNTFTAAQVQAPPVSRSQPGAMTLALLQAELDQAGSLLAALPGTTLDSLNTHTVVNSTIQSLQGWITNVQRTISGGTSTFTLGTGAGTPVTLTTRDLQAVDNLLVAALQALAGGATSATSDAADTRRKRAAAAGNAFQSATGSFVQAGVAGGSGAALASGANQLMVSLPEATSDLLVQLDGVLGYVVASQLATSGVVAGTPLLAAGNVGLGVGALGYAWLKSLIGLTDASAFILRNTWPETAVTGAIDRRNALLDAVAARGEHSAVGSAVLSELNGPAARGFIDMMSRPTDSTGDFLYLARDRLHGATGAVTVAPSGAIYSKAEVSLDRWQIPPRDSADPAGAFDIVRNPYHYSLGIPFSVSVAPSGSSVFTGWRIFAPFFNPYRSFDAQNPNGSYQSAGRSASIPLLMVRGGYFVIATFDLAHTLTVGSSVVAATIDVGLQREAETIPGAGGNIDRTPEPASYPGANGTMSPPAYLHGQKVKLEARPNPGYTFAGWTADYTGADNPATIEITRDMRVTANFRRTTTPVTYTLTINKTGAGSATGTVTKNPDKTAYTAGESVTLAAAGNGATFSGWSGDATGSANPLTVVMDRNKTITATFTAASGDASRFNGGYLGRSTNSDGSRGWDVFFDVRNGAVSPSRAGGNGTVSASGAITFTFSAGGSYTGTLAPDASGVMTGGGTFSGDVYSGRPQSGTWSVTRIRID